MNDERQKAIIKATKHFFHDLDCFITIAIYTILNVISKTIVKDSDESRVSATFEVVRRL